MKSQITVLLLMVLWAAATGRAGLVGQWTFENGSLADTRGTFEAMVLEGDAVVADGALDVNGFGTDATGWAHASALPSSAPIQNKTLVSWITLQGLNDVAVALGGMHMLWRGSGFDARESDATAA